MNTDTILRLLRTLHDKAEHVEHYQQGIQAGIDAILRASTDYIYRGQAYGEPAGEFWTSSRKDATDFAMSRGGNRQWVVLALEENDPEWLQQFIHAQGVGDEKATWYRIPEVKLRERWRGVRICDGALSLER